MNIVLSKRLGDYGYRFGRLAPRKGIIKAGEHEFKTIRIEGGEPVIQFKTIEEGDEGDPITESWDTYHPINESFLQSINQEHTSDETLATIFQGFLEYCFLCCQNQIDYAEKELATRVRWVTDPKRSGHFLDRIDKGLKEKIRKTINE